MPDRHGCLRRRTSFQSQAAGPRTPSTADASKIRGPYSNGQKNNFRDTEAIDEAVQRPTMKFVATKTADQLDLQALHRVRERLVMGALHSGPQGESAGCRILGSSGWVSASVGGV